MVTPGSRGAPRGSPVDSRELQQHRLQDLCEVGLIANAGRQDGK